eukprot:scaffold28063_cov15-Tisochrysis_lutea.AAC.1
MSTCNRLEQAEGRRLHFIPVGCCAFKEREGKLVVLLFGGVVPLVWKELAWMTDLGSTRNCFGCRQ